MIALNKFLAPIPYEGILIMTTTIVKIDDTTVAKVGTQEIRQVFGSTQLAERKAKLEAQLVEVKALIDVLAA